MNFVNRAIAVLTAPGPTLSRAAGEPATKQGLIVGYVAILAAVPILLGLLLTLIETRGYMGSAIIRSILLMIALYAVRNVGVTVLIGIGLSALAPNFGGRRDEVNGMKLAAYSSTPIWIAGLLIVLLGWLAPSLGGLLYIILLAGFGYAGYIIYLGVGPMLGVPKDQAPIVAGIATIAWLVLFFLTLEIVFRIFTGYGGMSMMI